MTPFCSIVICNDFDYCSIGIYQPTTWWILLMFYTNIPPDNLPSLSLVRSRLVSITSELLKITQAICQLKRSYVTSKHYLAVAAKKKSHIQNSLKYLNTIQKNSCYLSNINMWGCLNQKFLSTNRGLTLKLKALVCSPFHYILAILFSIILIFSIIFFLHRRSTPTWKNHISLKYV